MIKKQWYLLSYDIHHEKRLKKFHYRLRKRAIALQKSVFLIEADDTDLQHIIHLVDQYTHTQEDDVRLYPIAHPKAIWGAGIQSQAFSGLDISNATTPQKQSNFMSFVKQLWKSES